MAYYHQGGLTKEKVIGDETLYPYAPSKELVNAVNMAIVTERPLLIMGEPGCGKTSLAKAIAFTLHQESYSSFYEEWHIKSTTILKDGLYQLDAIRRLIDAQSPEKKDKEKAKNILHKDYFKPGPLLNIFRKAEKLSDTDPPAILLIDEIDKAPVDFPNDLLLELDKKQINVDLLDKPLTISKGKLLIIITSNQEKELPPAFLRRCIFQFIDFPTKDALLKIIEKRFPGGSLSTQEVEKYIQKFMALRAKNIDEKNISTSELIDWFHLAFHVGKLKQEERKLTEGERLLVQEWDEKYRNDLPFSQALFKKPANLTLAE